MSFYSIAAKTIGNAPLTYSHPHSGGICLFVYFTVLFKDKPRLYDGQVEDELFDKSCKKRTGSRNRSEEGFHYPNQTFYDLILSKDPEE